MAVTDSHTFGLAVLSDMGSPDAFTSHPLVKTALAMSAARAYQSWLDTESDPED